MDESKDFAKDKDVLPNQKANPNQQKYSTEHQDLAGPNFRADDVKYGGTDDIRLGGQKAGDLKPDPALEKGGLEHGGKGTNATNLKHDQNTNKGAPKGKNLE